MRRRIFYFVTLTALAGLFLRPAFAVVDVSQLAKKLLYGDSSTRTEAIKDFNKLPSEAQYRLVPDFMVAMSDPDPDVRKIAGRILKAMGVKTEGQIPDARSELPARPAKTSDEEKWTDEKNMKESNSDKWGDLKQMRGGESGNYADLKDQVEQEKKGQVSLDASSLLKESPDSASPLGTVVSSLKDPDPWVRAQAARRLAMVHPAPMDAIPLLVKMLGDKETESRRAAAAALGSFGPLAKDAVLPLNAALSDPDPAVKQIAAEALTQIQQPR